MERIWGGLGTGPRKGTTRENKKLALPAGYSEIGREIPKK